MSDRPTISTAQPGILRLADETSIAILQFLPCAALFKVEAFDARLFRTNKVEKNKLKPSDEIELHPILDLVDMVNLEDDQAEIEHEDGSTYNAYDYSAVSASVTQPACTKVKVNLGVGKTLTVSDMKGVKVARLLKAVAKFRHQRPPVKIRNHVASILGEPADYVTWKSCLLEHDEWSGWRRPRIDVDGAVLLETQDLQE
ncbi:hypothetical protein JCM11641_004012 [Rhodosporidiobolus odoratus]